MADAQPKRPTTHRGRVVRTERLSPRMVRIVLGGEGLREFRAGKFTDHYIKMHFPLPGVEYADPTDIAAIRSHLPWEQWPRMRTYTVRSWDAEVAELTVDFVHHGTTGLAGPWAATANPGDEVALSGPGGGYTPSAEADWHLLAPPSRPVGPVGHHLGEKRRGEEHRGDAVGCQRWVDQARRVERMALSGVSSAGVFAA